MRPSRTNKPVWWASLPLLVLASFASPGPVAGQDLDLDLDIEILPLAQLPVAMARLDAAGVPLADLRLIVPSLFEAGVPPSDILNTLRILPAVERRDVVFGVDDPDFRFGRDDDRAHGSRGMGSYVQHLHDRGLRGREMATAIHRELNRRGIPAGGDGRGVGRGGHEEDRFDSRRGVLERGFLLDVDDDDFVRGRGVPPGAGSGRGGPPARRGDPGRGPGGQGPPDRARDDDRRGPPGGARDDDRRGPPDRARDDDRRGPPAGARGEDRRGPPDARGGEGQGNGERGGPPESRGRSGEHSTGEER